MLMAAAPDVEKMRLLLDRGANVNARAQSRFSALMVAAQYQEAAAAIDLLLDRGAQVGPPAEGGAPVFNANPFFLASYAGNAVSLKRLRDAGAKIDEPMTLIPVWPRTRHLKPSWQNIESTRPVSQACTRTISPRPRRRGEPRQKSMRSFAGSLATLRSSSRSG